MTTRRPTMIDPPLRKDGLCARYPNCDKERQPNSKYGAAHEDPFCSTECCKEFWQVTGLIHASTQAR